MDRDDEIRAAIRQYADGDVGHPDLEAIRAGHRPVRRSGSVQTLLAVAVVLLIAIVGVVLVTQTLGRDRQQEPITPTPLPSVSQTASPTSSLSSATPTPSASDFPVNPGAGVNPEPVGGVGDTIAGLRLDAVKIRPGTCGEASCPEQFTLSLTNTSDVSGAWEVFAYTYRDGYAELGNATQVTLAPGEQAKAVITIDTAKAADSRGSANYSWNWAATSSGQ